MIEELLPPGVAAVESRDELMAIQLFPEEEAVIRRAVDKRRHEFITVRACARGALARLGLPASPILPGVRGAPSWPPGVVGSMTHCAGYRAAAVAWARDLRTIGVDAEPDAPLPGEVLAAVSRPEERDQLAGLAAGGPPIAWDRLLFCVKEAVYKAWSPLTGRWLDFHEASVELDPAGRFTATLLVPGPELDGRPLAGFTGRWLARDGHLLAATAVPTGTAHRRPPD